MQAPIAYQARRAATRFLILILSSFGLLMLMTGLFSLHAIDNISQLEDSMRQIFTERNRKIELVTDLQESSHNRHNALVYQVISTEAFERDEHFQQYIAAGYRVGKARNELRAMPLDDAERRSIDAQADILTRVVDLHELISDLAANGRLEAARTLLEQELRPLNLQMTSLLEDLRAYEKERISSALNATRAAAADAIEVNLALAAGLFLLALVIAAVTYRRLVHYARTVCTQMHALENVGEQLEHQATHDVLTGLANRALFYRRLEQDLVRAAQDQRSLMVVYIDLDDFKPVNDQHGHATGDALLKVVAARIRNAVRSNDTAARLGGDEFAVILSGAGGREEQRMLCQRLEDKIALPVDLDNLTLTPRCSLGHAVFPLDGGTLEALINAADVKMYEAKRRKKPPPTDALAPAA